MADAQAQAGTEKRTGPELRLALAMRGGVSLSVWIGGAVAEIDMVRRADEDDEVVQTGDEPDDADTARAKRNRNEARHFWSNLLDVSGYSRVVADVLAGASAGGLNGVLYAASQQYDFSYDAMRAIWLDVGDTEGLVRRELPFPSLFKGDEYFRDNVYEKVRCLIEQRGSSDAERPRLNLELSATALEPIERPVPSPGDQDLFDRRHGSGFRFRQADEPWLSSSFPPADEGPWFEAALRRLALASRATSSFPAAFEAAEVVSRRRVTFGATVDEPPRGYPVDLDGNFLDRTCGPSFTVADGGVLDNIPIRRALDAAVRAPANGPTTRVLVYLQPGSTSGEAGDATPEDGDGYDRRTSTYSVATGSLAARVSGENINADIDAIEAHNEAIRRSAAIRAGGLGQVAGRQALLDRSGEAWDAYASTRAADDARRIVELLRDPVGVLGYDPFPRWLRGRDGRWQEPGDARWRSPIACWAQHRRRDLGPRLLGEIEGRLGDRSQRSHVLTAVHEPGPLRRVTLLLLEWARFLEPANPGVGAIKHELYRVYAFIEEACVGATQQAWVAAAAAAPATGDAALGERVLPCLARIFDVPNATEVVEALPSSDGTTVGPAIREAYVRIDEVVGDAGGATPAPALLDALAAKLLSLANLLAPLSAPEPADPMGKLLHDALAGAGDLTLAHLAALEIVCFPEFVAGLPGRRDVTFQRCSSENSTPLASHFPKLEPDGDKIPVSNKLAGNELANFSAFLLPVWRANDWMWGRLDAVVSMVELLVTPTRLGDWLDLAVPGPVSDEVVEARVAMLVAKLEPAYSSWGETTAAGETVAVAAKAWSPQAIAQALAIAASTTAEQRAALDVSAIRASVIAQRQWGVLQAEFSSQIIELARSRGQADPPELTLPGTVAWAGLYDRGMQTLGSTEHRRTLRHKTTAIVVAAMRMIVWNLQRGRPKGASPWYATGGLWRLGRLVGWYAAKQATEPKAPKRVGQPPVSKKGRWAKVGGHLKWLVPVLGFIGLGVCSLIGNDLTGRILGAVTVGLGVALALSAIWFRWSANRIDGWIRNDATRRATQRAEVWNGRWPDKGPPAS